MHDRLGGQPKLTQSIVVIDTEDIIDKINKYLQHVVKTK